jgi:hypothetical protein
MDRRLVMGRARMGVNSWLCAGAGKDRRLESAAATGRPKKHPCRKLGLLRIMQFLFLYCGSGNYNKGRRQSVNRLFGQLMTSEASPGDWRILGK